jgi:hypothetical protein
MSRFERVTSTETPQGAKKKMTKATKRSYIGWPEWRIPCNCSWLEQHARSYRSMYISCASRLRCTLFAPFSFRFCWLLPKILPHLPLPIRAYVHGRFHATYPFCCSMSSRARMFFQALCRSSTSLCMLFLTSKFASADLILSMPQQNLAHICCRFYKINAVLSLCSLMKFNQQM